MLFFKLFIVSAVVCASYAQNVFTRTLNGNNRLGQLRSTNDIHNQQSHEIRNSMAKAIRDNLVNQRSPLATEQTSINLPPAPISFKNTNTAEDTPIIDEISNFQLPNALERQQQQRQQLHQLQQQQKFLQQQHNEQGDLTATVQHPNLAPVTRGPVSQFRNTDNQPIVHQQTRTAVETNKLSAEQIAIEEQNAEQAQNAHYSFDSSVQDTINDHAHTRTETRDGLNLRGMYSYSDGFFRRTVHYAADAGGYRVTKEEIEPIGDGPRFNPKGKADISGSLSGNYTITTEDFKREPVLQSI